MERDLKDEGAPAPDPAPGHCPVGTCGATAKVMEGSGVAQPRRKRSKWFEVSHRPFDQPHWRVTTGHKTGREDCIRSTRCTYNIGWQTHGNTMAITWQHNLCDTRGMANTWQLHFAARAWNSVAPAETRRYAASPCRLAPRRRRGCLDAPWTGFAGHGVTPREAPDATSIFRAMLQCLAYIRHANIMNDTDVQGNLS